jgi:F-type H+-transporting ATPase subunit gamma
MAKTRELRRRIRSIENTRQITRTMEMVATSRLKRAQDRVVAARPYAQALADVLGHLFSPELAERFPLLRVPPTPPRRVALVGLTSNRGLCGAFNANLIRETRYRLRELEDEGTEVELHLIGRKGIGFFKFLGRAVASQRQDVGDRPTMAQAIELVTPLMERFASGELDRVEIIFARFVSALQTPPTRLAVLPVAPPAGRRASGPAGGKHPHAALNYIFKPSAEELLERLLPLYVQNQVFRALVENAASEQGARRTAMKSATDSAGEMIDLLRRTFNRARQAQITQEIAEIVGGTEALRG